MMSQATPVQLTVLRRGRPSGASVNGLLADGTLLISAGTLVVGGVIAEAIKVLSGEDGARLWFLGIAVAGVMGVLIGALQRRSHRRRLRVGVVVSAFDPRLGTTGRHAIESAETFAARSTEVGLAVRADLTGDLAADEPTMRQLAEDLSLALTIGDRLTPDATQVNLVPIMRLHVAFWLGAQLGHTHSRGVAVYGVGRGEGQPRYFLAASLRDDDLPEPLPTPLVVGDKLEDVPGVDSDRIALAVDTGAKGDAFLDPVRTACREIGIGSILVVRNPARRLAQDRATFTAALDQICRAWREMPLPAGARSGHQSVFLSCPVAFALPLGARLAAAQPGAWTAYTLEPNTNAFAYEAFPPPPTSSS